MTRRRDIEITKEMVAALPAKVRVHRLHRKQSYRQAAEIIGCPYGHLCNFKNGKVEPRRPFILDLLNYLET